jgi:glycosyltransferase involved in cell wall biosynthesis
MAAPKISCCMIVKNEEAFLAKCLESVRLHVDEIVIVDTGSTDGTVDIAGRYTDRVYFHPWENSFSKARNYSLSHASGDWIFVIDADEELLPASGPALRQSVAGAGSADALFVNITSTYSNGKKTARHNLERIFRNSRGIRFEGIVHNRLVGAKEVAGSKVELMHYGYDLNEKKRHEKFLRTSGLLKQAIEQEPENPAPRHYLGTSYLSVRMYDDCIRESLLAIELADRQGNDDTMFLWSHYNAAMAFLAKKDFDRAGQLARKAIAVFPGHLDSHHVLTLVSSHRREWGNVRAHGGRYLELLDMYEKDARKAGMIINCTLKEAPAVHILLGYAEYHLQNIPGMLASFAAASRKMEREWESWVGAANYFIDACGDLELARDLLERVRGADRDEREFLYTLARLDKKTGNAREERECLKKICRADGPDQKDIRLFRRLALLCIEAGDYPEALEALLEAGRLDPADYPVLINTARVYNRLGRFRQAVEYYTAAIERKEAAADCTPWIELGDLCLALDRPDDAGLFYNRALQIEPGRLEAVLKAAEADLLGGRVEDFIGRCDAALRELGMNRNRAVDSMDDLAAILLEIETGLSDSPELAEMALRLRRFLPGSDCRQARTDMAAGPAGLRKGGRP